VNHDLSEDQIETLIAAAREGQAAAYAPYSNFRVGAALLTDTGEIIRGCNVENASYGLSICAERTAMTRCVVGRHGKPVAIVVCGDTPEPLAPCGACRQFLYEFNPAMPVICVGLSGARRSYRLYQLLPGAFDQESLSSVVREEMEEEG
jgi:cytidine deaminase